jgi:hypothetical protein
MPAGFPARRDMDRLEPQEMLCMVYSGYALLCQVVLLEHSRLIVCGDSVTPSVTMTDRVFQALSLEGPSLEVDFL